MAVCLSNSLILKTLLWTPPDVSQFCCRPELVHLIHLVKGLIISLQFESDLLAQEYIKYKSSGGGNSSKNDFRRKWDKDEYEQLAQKRLDEERDKKDGKPAPPVKRELLRHRDYKVDLESKLGKTIVITKTTPQAEMGGYYCNVCDCVVKDSINFLDHINGKKHQRNLGMSMRVERSSLDQVKKRFEVNKKKIEEKQTEYDFEERMKELREEEEKAKAYKKEKQKEKKRKAEEDLFEEDDEMAAVMGFSGFGSSKKGK
ncbi:zinc finger matrin-type protein 2 isoform 1-T1 [Salvelinus alpinus]|nr:zinc finger matrin-type protein 2 isoform X1 [Salvelinus alpinus]